MATEVNKVNEGASGVITGADKVTTVLEEYEEQCISLLQVSGLGMRAAVHPNIVSPSRPGLGCEEC